MGKKINLFWYKHNKGYGNFGDELNPYIIEKLSGIETNYINIENLYPNKWINFKIIISALLNNKIKINEFLKYLYYNFFAKPKVLLAIGSVLQYNKHGNCDVWGSGIIDENYTFANARFHAVRGLYSQRKLKELGYKVPKVVGDPALLLPLVYQPNVYKKYKLGVIPHYVHYEELKSFFSEDVLVINMLDSIEIVVDQIVSCEITFSTSLHGVIVSHAYGIPSIWTEFSMVKHKLFGDNVKFKDYFSSVNLREYQVFIMDEIKQLHDETVKESYRDVLLPDSEVIKNVQHNLLRVAPFPIKKI